ncbi:MAG: 50S ribosomal protein L21 [candidate division WOR-3 bacterium]|jgi:large subunit ribosomal protein L21
MRYAIVEVSGTQMKVEEGKEIVVNRIKANEGEYIELKDVLFIKDNGNYIFGNPKIENAKVIAKVLQHFKGPKILVFKYKRKNNYRRRRGHRQYLSKLLIEKIEF